MNDSNLVASEDKLDRMQTIFALGMLCVGLALGTSAMRELVENQGSFYELLSFLRAGAGITAALLMVTMLWIRVSFLRSGTQSHFIEGFVHHANTRAMAVSWVLTFAALTIMTEQIDGGEVLPAEFYTKMATAILLATFSVSYFFISRIPSE